MRLRTHTSPGIRAAYTLAASGRKSANASSTTSTRPGLARAASTSSGSWRPVGLSGRPSTTRSASSGTAAGSRAKPSAASRTTWCTGTPQERRAASGAVNDGCTHAASRGRSAWASSQNASAAPLSSRHSSVATPCRAATAATAGAWSGYAARSTACRSRISQSGGGPQDVDGEVDGSGRDLPVAVVAKEVFEGVHH